MFQFISAKQRGLICMVD